MIVDLVLAGLAIPLAHHPLFVALPFVIPAFTLGGAVVVLSLRERRRRELEGDGSSGVSS